MNMQREEKQFESAIDSVCMKVNDLKTTLSSMIFKVEHEYETLNWTNLLDNFALISGHLTSLSKFLGQEKAPNLRNYTVLPLHLSPEKDPDLVRITEGRISTFAHDLVPDYLRTKPDPCVEQKIIMYESKAANLSYDASHKQMAQYSKVINHVWEIANKAKEEWESETGNRNAQTLTSSSTDTHLLVNAVGNGKGLKSENVQMVQPMMNQVNSNILVGRNNGQAGAIPPGSMVSQMNKSASAIKTNIKAASQIHPYNR